MKTTHNLVATLILLTACFDPSEAASLKVGPGGFIIHNVVPGRTYDVYKETGLQLTIYNDSAESKTYLLSTHRPAQDGKWEKGYLEIPDPTWCRFEQEEITVEANSNACARFYLTLPDSERYYNQHWVVTLGVSGKPGSGAIGVAINVRAQIETQSKPDTNGTYPFGAVSVVPSVISLNPGEPGKIVVINNSAVAEEYSVSALTDPEKFKTYIAAGFSPLADPAWIVLSDRSLVIPAGERRTLRLDLAMPETERNSIANREAIILIEGKDATGFLRVRIAGPDEGLREKGPELQ